MILSILAILGAIGLFLFGMKTMSEAVQKLSGNRLRKRFAALAASPTRSIFSGCAITALVQSSSAVTVMIVSFVNAGLLSLRQAIGMVMGANIGTTITTWIVVLYGLQFGIDSAALPLLAFAVPLILLRNKSKWHISGSLLIGLGLMLLAIQLLRTYITTLTNDSSFETYLSQLCDHGAFSPLLFVGAGALFTAALQSSSVTTTLTVVLYSSGVISFDYALAMILGDNLGTTLTANIAAMVTDAAGKRAALSHVLFNLIGILWALPLLSPISLGLEALTTELSASFHFALSATQPLGLALFHSLFNVCNTLLLAPFIPQLARLTTILIPKHCFEEQNSSQPGNSLVATNEMNLYPIRREAEDCLKQLSEISARTRVYFGEVNNDSARSIRLTIESQIQDLYKRLTQCEERLALISCEDISSTGLQFMQLMQQIFAETRTAIQLNETALQIIHRKKERYIWFNQTMREDLGVLFSLTHEAYLLTAENIRDLQENPQRVERGRKMDAFLHEFALTLDEKYLSAPTQDLDGEEPQYRAGMIFAELSACIRRLAKSVLTLANETGHLHRFGR